MDDLPIGQPRPLTPSDGSVGAKPADHQRRPNGRYCVVIPAFNVETDIGGLVEQVRKLGFTVVVVDDGSTDQTAHAASRHGALVISHVRNRGKGSALRSGFQYALRMQFDGVVTLDGDGQHNPGEIPELIRAGEQQHAGIVLGNRMEHAGAMPALRRWTNRLMSRMVSFVARQRIPDSQCGFRFIRKEVLASVRLSASRFEIETELLLAAAKRRWKTISIPVETIYRNHPSGIRPLRDTLRFCGVMLRYLG